MDDEAAWRKIAETEPHGEIVLLNSDGSMKSREQVIAEITACMNARGPKRGAGSSSELKPSEDMHNLADTLLKTAKEEWDAFLERQSQLVKKDRTDEE